MIRFTWINRLTVWIFVLFLASTTAFAQFKVIGPAPYPPAVARQKIKSLLEGMNAANQPQTVQTLSGLLSWYRDIEDEELIAAWHKDSRANLIGSIETLADARIASGIIEFSWRDQRDAAFLPAYAPTFGNLFTRFPESARPFLDDLLGPISAGTPLPNLSPAAAETLCRILLDMPDVGTSRRSALAIVPHYRRAAENVLNQDLHGSDQEKSYQARRWRDDLKLDPPATSTPRTNAPVIARATRDDPSPRRPPRASLSGGTPAGNQTASVNLVEEDRDEEPPSLKRATAPPPTPIPARASLPEPTLAPVPATPTPYAGPISGTLEATGVLIPQNAEYVFRNVPLTNLQLDYDHKIWDARLAPGDGGTQRLIVKNKSSGPQKRCVVRWSVVP